MESSREHRKRTRSNPSVAREEEETAPRCPASKRVSGGIYVPPHSETAANNDDEAAYDERRSWDALRKSLTGLINRATPAHIRHVARELLAENLVRGRGLLCRALMRSQAACPAFTDVFAALAAVVNAKIPSVGRLLLVRLVLGLRRAHAIGDRHQLAAAAGFVAHLVNQGVAHDLLALELVTLLLDEATEDTVDVAAAFITECGATLRESCPRGLDAVFDTLRAILHDGNVDRRVQFVIEDLFALRRAQFKGHPPVRPELDLIKPEDQVTHQIELCDRQLDPEVHLDLFKPSPSFFRDEAAYEDLKRGMLGEDAGDNGESIQSCVEEPDCSDDESGEEESETDSVIRDDTETNLTNLRRTIYLTVMSSVDSEEAGHKLMSVVRPGQETELCSMLLECRRKERAYTRYYGQLGQRLCAIHPAYQAGFEACFASHYSTLHRVETNELRATAMFFAHLLATDALPWRGVLGRVRVTEDDTTSSSRIFIKMLFQDLSEHLGVSVLSRKMNQDDTEVRDALFPRDCAKNTRFAINFFTAIGLGSVTSPARELLLQS
ncbi:unnamed protein product [Urochloa decumbens]|uniref:MI domain-containing protein n=1 Tax=Urochloa decumbens TaxID=240449 RepID=A0ABC8VZX2_9POAL